MSDFDTDYTNLVTCPYCGYEEKDSWEYESSGEGSCNRCGKDFYVEIETSVSYTTSKLKEKTA